MFDNVHWYDSRPIGNSTINIGSYYALEHKR
jgi:hypothetical protein